MRAQDPRLARRVGAITLAALAAVTAGLVFLLDRVTLGSPVAFRVVFRHTAGLHERAPLIVAGRPIGRVTAIVPVLHGAPGPLAGEVGVAATVEVAGDEAWKVPAGATIFVASRGPLSDRYLEVAPPAGDLGPPVAPGAELRGVDPPTLDNVLQHTWNNLTTYQRFVDAVRPELAALRVQLATLRGRWDTVAPGGAGVADGITGLAAATRGARAAGTRTYDGALGGGSGIARLAATARDARQAIAELRAAIDVLGPLAAAAAAELARVRSHLAGSDPAAHAAEVLARVRRALDQIDPLLAAATELADRLARGEGSIGRLMSDPEFPEDTKELGKYLKRHPWKILERPAD